MGPVTVDPVPYGAQPQPLFFLSSNRSFEYRPISNLQIRRSDTKPFQITHLSGSVYWVGSVWSSGVARHNKLPASSLALL